MPVRSVILRAATGREDSEWITGVAIMDSVIAPICEFVLKAIDLDLVVYDCSN